MARLFTSDEERLMVNELTREIVQKVAGQQVFYCGISSEHTKTHDLYNESTKKVYLQPTAINALVFFEEPRQTTTDSGPDRIHRIEVYFHNDELSQRNIKIYTGDFVIYGPVVYEILESKEDQHLHGMVEYPIMTKCICQTARKGSFDPRFVRPANEKGLDRNDRPDIGSGSYDSPYY